MKRLVAKIGNVCVGAGNPIAVQTMCNTHTADVPASLEQCRRLAAEGADIIRLTVQGMAEVRAISEIRSALRAEGIGVPLVADIHFRSDVALAAAEVVEKVRVNPGNFHKDFSRACEDFRALMEKCREYGTAIRIGINHGSLGERITSLYGNTAEGMAKAAMEWLQMCVDNDFYNVVLSLKASNVCVMVQAYRLVAEYMKQAGVWFPMHLGVTEAGNGDAARIKSAVGIGTLLREGIGDTIRVSLTEDPAAEIPVGRYIAGLPEERLSLRDKQILDASLRFGPDLLDRKIDSVPELDEYILKELLQATRRRFYRPEYVACPGCGRTMYNLQETFEKVKAATSSLGANVCIAVMGCIVNGPGEMADADFGYIGEGRGKVSIYRGKERVYAHIDENEALPLLMDLIGSSI